MPSRYICKKCGQIFNKKNVSTHSVMVLQGLNQYPPTTWEKCDGEIVLIKLGYTEGLTNWIKKTVADANELTEPKQLEREAFIKTIISQINQDNPVKRATWFVNLASQGAFGSGVYLTEEDCLRGFDFNAGEPIRDEEAEFVDQLTKSIIANKSLPIELSKIEKEKQEQALKPKRQDPQHEKKEFYINNELFSSIYIPLKAGEVEPRRAINSSEPLPPKPAPPEDFEIILTGDGHKETVHLENAEGKP